MKLLTIDRWQVVCDYEATIAAYASTDAWGEKGSCVCSYCKNFFTAINQAYPPEFVAILNQLGTRPGEETEVFQYNREPNGLHIYGGWFSFIGSILSGIDGMAVTSEKTRMPNVQITERFGYFLTSDRHYWIPTAFKDKGLVTVEFTTQIPWVIDDKDPS